MSEPLEDGDPPAGLRLTTAEWGLWQAFRNGTRHDLRTGDLAEDDPGGDRVWGPRRTVRARVISTLLLHGPPPLLGRVAALHLSGALITGRLDLSGGTVQPYFELRHCRFDEEVLLSECRLSTGRLLGCRLPRLEAARLTTDGDLHLPRCSIPGGIRLTDAVIGTDLMLNEVTVGGGRRGRAIAADGMTVGQDLQASLLLAGGEVSLRGARIGGSLFMYGSELRNRRGPYALHAPQLEVARFAHFASFGNAGARHLLSSTPPTGTRYPLTGRDGARPQLRPHPSPDPSGPPVQPFLCDGGMKLDDGRFGDSLVLEGARLELERGQELSLRRVQTPELCFTPERVTEGRVVLAGATVGNLVDRADSWPRHEGLWMAGFSYEHLIPIGSFPLAERLRWVATATPEYSAEPYEQLATVLRNGGEDNEARTVLLAKQRRRRETLPLAGKLWGYLQDWTVAYGYQPVRALLWMLLLWASGALFFRSNAPEPRNDEESPHWDAGVYALDLLLPLIDLGHDTAWRPEGFHQWMATGLVLAGWVLATTVAAGATRLLRRQ
ncbi:oxidoreductase [Streptomyces durbertensis]|uniref:Oxidoreductase n=1 Tax=Streptomyces durbertensis TaxID=2448886 RepID=A0ABR6EC17_9ACTN|nr:oxidoreductase [Streptomyces durbertensis]MBB1242869.1 oxidoreductase [Streptomyces durbertensis]